MPHGHRRAEVARALTRNYLDWLRARQRRAQQRRARMHETKRIISELSKAHRVQDFLDDWEMSSLSSASDADTSNSDTDSDTDMSNTSDSMDSDTSDTSGSDTDTDTSSSDESSSDDGSISSGEINLDSLFEEDAMPELRAYVPEDDDEWSTEDEYLEDEIPPTNNLRNAVQEEIDQMYSSRYQAPRTRLPRPAESFLHHTLITLKNQRPDHFREQLRVSPYTFDRLVEAIEDDVIFQNDSDNMQQAPVEEQLAVALYRFGRDGNGASMQSVANWAGIGKGTVKLWTSRVMTAVLRKDFMDRAVHYPTEEEKESAKEWVAAHSCPAWRDGWCFVDGTLIPLAMKPYWYGESYFDRKCRYSLNVQVINLPNLRIIDFAYGHTGSTHDATAWEGTRLAQEHNNLLDDGEWIWADSAYPIRDWVVSPFKKPERYQPDNDTFNKQVSQLRIRSEHAIGFLKGRFHSLKGLRLSIRNARTHRIATYWIAACIGIHSFAMDCELKERDAEEDMDAFAQDPFLAEGLQDDESDTEEGEADGNMRPSARRLKAGREKREQLRRRLLRHRERVQQRRRQR